MAIYRPIYTSFWTDSKIQDNLTPEDRYFFMYLLTNPLTNTLGCYEISKRIMTHDTGYMMDVIEKLIERFSEKHQMIKYDNDTKELLIENWGKYNWLKSDKTLARIMIELNFLKSDTLKQELLCRLKEHYQKDLNIDTPYKGHTRGSYAEHKQEHNNNMNNNMNKSKKKSVDKQPSDMPLIKKIVDHLNSSAKTKFKTSSVKTQDLIKARINDGFDLEDFYKVIDIKCDEWLDSEMAQYLRPETLFSNKFEGYLNQKPFVKKGNTENLASHKDTDESIKKAKDIGILVV